MTTLSEQADAAYKRDILAASQKSEKNVDVAPVQPAQPDPANATDEADVISAITRWAKSGMDDDGRECGSVQLMLDRLREILEEYPAREPFSEVRLEELIRLHAPLVYAKKLVEKSVAKPVSPEPKPVDSKPALPAMTLAEQKAWFEEHYNANKPSWIFQHTTNASQLDSEPPKWLIEGMIYKTGLHLFSGREGSTKSLLHLMLAGALCRGYDFMGRKNGEGPMSVVYVDKENPQSEVRLRCARLGLLGLETFRIWGDWDSTNPPPETFDDDRLRECARRERPFFIFDSLSSFLDGANEIDAGQMTLVLGKARSLARLCAGVSIIHHQGVNTERSRGSTAIAAASDMAFLLKKERHQGKDRITLTDERFRMTGSYRMVWDMDYANLYSMTVIENGLTGDQAIAPAKAEPKPKKETTMGDAELIERAGVEIEKVYAAGQTATQGQLAVLVGIASQKIRSRILIGRPDRPWNCIPGPNNSTLFLPKGVTEIPVVGAQR